MSNIFQKLKELVVYYDVTRQIGHTTQMLNGAYKIVSGGFTTFQNKCLVLTYNQDMADYLNNGLKVPYEKAYEAVPFTDTNCQYVLRGKKYPILFDNALLHILFKESANRMEELSIENLKLKSDITNLKKENKQLGDDVISLKSENYNKYDIIKKLQIDNHLLNVDNKTLNDFNKEHKSKEIESITIKYK